MPTSTRRRSARRGRPERIADMSATTSRRALRSSRRQLLQYCCSRSPRPGHRSSKDGARLR
eukprot:4196894-Heterocapsa_arctica.AAC.1